MSPEQTKREARKLVATRLRQLRESHGYTQERAAAKLGISHSALSAYETGTRAITVDRLALLAKYYEVPLPELLTSQTRREGP